MRPSPILITAHYHRVGSDGSEISQLDWDIILGVEDASEVASQWDADDHHQQVEAHILTPGSEVTDVLLDEDLQTEPEPEPEPELDKTGGLQ